jgi:ABC-type glutathione transport system ATPase component
MPQDQALRRAHEVLEYCALGEARYRNVETYSTGMKQRIKLAQALVHGPKLLFLDEPTNGLDPEGRDDMLALIRDISHGKNVNVVVSSHLLPDIERTCDAVIVMKNGQVVTQGSIAALRQTAGVQVEVELRAFSPAFVSRLAEDAGARLASRQGSLCRFDFAAPPAPAWGALFSRRRARRARRSAGSAPRSAASKTSSWRPWNDSRRTVPGGGAPGAPPPPASTIADLSYRTYDGELKTRAARWWIVPWRRCGRTSTGASWASGYRPR